MLAYRSGDFWQIIYLYASMRSPENQWTRQSATLHPSDTVRSVWYYCNLANIVDGDDRTIASPVDIIAEPVRNMPAFELFSLNIFFAISRYQLIMHVLSTSDLCAVGSHFHIIVV